MLLIKMRLFERCFFKFLQPSTDLPELALVYWRRFKENQFPNYMANG